MVRSFLVLAMATVAGCSRAGSEAPVVGEFLLGRGGGFTGLYTGHLVRSDGRVFRWSQMPGQAERMEEVGHVPADSLQPFFRQLVAWEQKKLTIAGSGNLTEFIEFRHGQHRYRLQWGIGDDVPEEVQAFVTVVHTFLRRHLP